MKKVDIKIIGKFLLAILRHTLDRWRKLKGLHYEIRVHECMQCEELDNTPNPWEHCNMCGCPVREKASWRSETCPKNKWIRI